MFQSYVLTLYSTLSRTQYDFTLPQVTFTSSGFHKHVSLTFNPTVRPTFLSSSRTERAIGSEDLSPIVFCVPQRKVPDQDVAQGSYIALPLTLLLLLAAYNHEKVTLFCDLLHPKRSVGLTRLLLGPAGDPPPAAGGQPHPGREDHGPGQQQRRRRAGGRQTPGQETESQTHMNCSSYPPPPRP